MARHSQWGWQAAMFAGAVLLVALVTGSRADTPAKTATGATPAAKSFSHEAHADELDMKKCETCHKSKEAKPAPTTRSHAPCLASGCHIDDFLSTGPRTKKEDPPAYKAATAFCAVCHKSSKGEPPKRFSKAKADALYESKVGANFHVEMNHREHSERTACSSCHRVDSTSMKLVSGGPSHTECATCHEDSEQPMSKCDSCHGAPGPEQYFTKTRKSSDVRSCTDDSDPKRPCFKHEREEHRFLADKTQIECSSCHFMFKQKKYQGKSYESLADVKGAPMMDNKRDLAHKNCGSSGCHRREVDDSTGTGKCTQCHSGKFMANSLTD